ncbi:hypothetical protein OBV_26950 [Oscillibacter valericigenes Sjm18-20]|nr:hypothetical protein OBV_26950 [Oscillibacter valericigenes Sjm18-20]
MGFVAVLCFGGDCIHDRGRLPVTAILEKYRPPLPHAKAKVVSCRSFGSRFL